VTKAPLVGAAFRIAGFARDPSAPTDRCARRHVNGRILNPVDLEGAEEEAYLDAFRAAPPSLARDHGIAYSRIDGVTCTSVADLPRSRIFNHVFGLGRARPATDEELDRIAEFYGEETYFVALARDAQPNDLAARLEARGFEADYAWTKFRRGVEPPSEVDTELRVEPIGPQHTRDFGRIVAAGFELPEFVGRWLAALFARPRWTCFLAFADNTPAAAGTLFVSQGVGWLSFASTLPEFRRRGAQTALLAERIRAAAQLGCSMVVGETGAFEEGRESNSYRNIVRAGFEPVYDRPNYRSPSG
jgi:GNAT superfamily N-acetyltransferase